MGGWKGGWKGGRERGSEGARGRGRNVFTKKTQNGMIKFVWK